MTKSKINEQFYRFYQLIFNKGDMAIIDVDINFNIIDINKTSIEWFFLNENDILDKSFNIITGLILEGFEYCDFEMVINKNILLERKVKIKTNNDEFFSSDLMIYPLLNNSNEIISVLFVLKNKVDSLPYKYWQQVIDVIPGSVYIKDKNGTILICNQYMLNLAGVSSLSEITGKKDDELTWSKTSNRVIEVDKRVINTGKSITEEEEGLIVGNVMRTFLSHKAPLKNENNEIIGLVGVSQDITELKEARAREKTALLTIAEQKKATLIAEKEAEKLRERIQTMELLGGSIAHEIRNPLLAIRGASNAISNFLPTVIDGYKEAENAHLKIKTLLARELEFLPTATNTILREIDQTNLFIDILLSKIKDSVDQHDMQACTIFDCIDETLNRYPFRSNEQAKKVHWEKNLDFGFIGNKTLMIHLFFNLLKNALFYIEDARKGEITIWVEEDDKYHYLYFKDTGKGISEEYLPHLFTRFFSRTRHGTGLGLAFCKMVMESLRGDITCCSIEGEYAQFILSFPKR